MANDSYIYVIGVIAVVLLAGLILYQFLPKTQTLEIKPEDQLVNFVTSNLRSEFVQNMSVTKVNSSLYFAQWYINDSHTINQTRFGAYLSNPGQQSVSQIFILTPTNSVNKSVALLGVYFTTADVHNTDWKCAYLGSIGGYLTCQRNVNGTTSKTYWSVVISNYTRFTVCKEPKDGTVC